MRSQRASVVSGSRLAVESLPPVRLGIAAVIAAERISPDVRAFSFAKGIAMVRQVKDPGIGTGPRRDLADAQLPDLEPSTLKLRRSKAVTFNVPIDVWRKIRAEAISGRVPIAQLCRDIVLAEFGRPKAA